MIDNIFIVEKDISCVNIPNNTKKILFKENICDLSKYNKMDVYIKFKNRPSHDNPIYKQHNVYLLLGKWNKKIIDVDDYKLYFNNNMKKINIGKKYYAYKIQYDENGEMRKKIYSKIYLDDNYYTFPIHFIKL